MLNYAHRLMRSTFHGIISPTRLTSSEFLFVKLHRWCFCTGRKTRSRLPKMECNVAAKKNDAFYVVRKGDLIGVYRSFKDCQEQLSSFICDPAVSVYKGNSLKEETEKFLCSRGLRNAIYVIHSADAKDDIFGALFPCSVQDVSVPEPSAEFPVEKVEVSETILGSLQSENDVAEPEHLAEFSVEKIEVSETIVGSLNSDSASCIIEFDGASRGNPGRAGAGVVIRSEDGAVIYRLREGLGVATNNVAEYRAMILGLRCALKKGFKTIKIQGDSKLVCNQLSGVWQTRHKNLVSLNKEAIELKEQFLSFDVRHVRREFNSAADTEANCAVELPNGEVQELSAES